MNLSASELTKLGFLAEWRWEIYNQIRVAEETYLSH